MYIHAHRLYMYTYTHRHTLHVGIYPHGAHRHNPSSHSVGETPREMGWGEKVLEAVVILRPDACLDHLSHLHIFVLR